MRLDGSSGGDKGAGVGEGVVALIWSTAAQQHEREAGDWRRCCADSAKPVSCTFQGGCHHYSDLKLSAAASG